MQGKSQKAEISDASGAQGVSGHSPKRVWLRIIGGGMTLPSGKSYITLVGEDREMPKHVEYVRADLTGDLVKTLEQAERTLEQLATNQLSDLNCASVEVARRRISGIAGPTLAAVTAALASSREVRS